MVWLRQSPVIIEITVIRRSLLSQEPGKGAVFLQGSARNFPCRSSPCSTALSRGCPDRQAPSPASSLVLWGPAGKHSKWPVLSSSPQGKHHKLETTMEMSHGKPLSYTRNHSHASTEHYPGYSSSDRLSSLLWLPTRISNAWLVVHQCSSPLCKVTLVYPNSNSKNFLSFSSPGPAARQHLGKVQLRQELFFLQLQR